MEENIIAKARNCKSIEELIALAKDNGSLLTTEQAESYFHQLQASGELSDNELDNVSGGGCYSDDGYLMTTIGYGCEHFEDYGEGAVGVSGTCCRCKHWKMSAASQAIIFGQPAPCLHPANRKR